MDSHDVDITHLMVAGQTLPHPSGSHVQHRAPGCHPGQGQGRGHRYSSGLVDGYETWIHNIGHWDALYICTRSIKVMTAMRLDCLLL